MALKVTTLAITATMLASTSARAQKVPPSGDHAPHQIHTLRVPDAALEYVDFGGPTGRPVLVFLPGYGNTAHSYDDIAPSFTDHFRVLALTPRGQGRSSTPDSGYTIGTAAADVHALLDSLGVKRAVLVGHSVAGATITRFGALWPNRTAALIYLDATMDFANRDIVLGANPVPRPAPTDSTPAGMRRWLADVFYGFWSPALDNDMTSYSSDSAAQNRSRLLPALLADATSHPKEYRLIKAPVLAIVAVKTVAGNYPWLRNSHDMALRQRAQDYLDHVLNPWYEAGAARLKLECPDASVVRIPGHHFIFIAAKRRVVQAITVFFASLTL